MTSSLGTRTATSEVRPAAWASEASLLQGCRTVSFDPHEIAGVFGRAAESDDTVVPFFAEFGESVLDVGCGRGAQSLDVEASTQLLDPAVLEELRLEMFTELAARRTTAGIPMPQTSMPQTAVFVVAER